MQPKIVFGNMMIYGYILRQYTHSKATIRFDFQAGSPVSWSDSIISHIVVEHRKMALEFKVGDLVWYILHIYCFVVVNNEPYVKYLNSFT